MPLLWSLAWCAGRVVAIDMALLQSWTWRPGAVFSAMTRDEGKVRQLGGAQAVISEVEVEAEFAGFDLKVSDDFREYPGLFGR
jgi:hypothetical protein